MSGRVETIGDATLSVMVPRVSRPWMWATAGQQPPIEWEKWAAAVDTICGMIDQLGKR